MTLHSATLNLRLVAHRQHSQEFLSQRLEQIHCHCDLLLLVWLSQVEFLNRVRHSSFYLFAFDEVTQRRAGSKFAMFRVLGGEERVSSLVK